MKHNVEITVEESLEPPDWLSRHGIYCDALLELLSLEEHCFGLLLCKDSLMQSLNWYYRQLAETTDVLSFSQFPAGYPYHRQSVSSRRPQGPPFAAAAAEWRYLGDIAISLDQAARQADAQHCSIEEEVRQLSVHGMLHLLGYDHNYQPDIHTEAMLILQEQIIVQLSPCFLLPSKLSGASYRV